MPRRSGAGKNMTKGRRVLITNWGKKEAYLAQVQSSKSDIDTLTKRVQRLTGSVSKDEADLIAATKLRKHEHKSHLDLDRVITASIDTINRAIKVIRDKSKKGGGFFLQRPTRGMELFEASIREILEASVVFGQSDRSRLDDATRERRSSHAKRLASGNSPTSDTGQQATNDVEEILRDMLDKAVESQANERRKEKN